VLRPVVLAVLGGLATAASVQPVGLWPPGLVGAGLLTLAWSQATSRKARAVAGALWALSLLACTTFWVTDFQAVGYVVLALLGASFFTAAGALVPSGGAGAGVGAALPAGERIGSLRIAAVQGGGPRGTRGVETAEREVFDRHLAASRTIAPGAADVVVWPENAVSLPGPTAGSPEGEELAAEARRLQAVLLVGVVEDVPPAQFRNAQLAYAPDGQLVGRYDKVHRVPFGEYAPLRDLVAKVVDLSLLPRDAIRGEGPGILLGPGGQPLGVVISYEVFFGDRSRSAIRAAATSWSGTWLVA